MLYVYIKQKLNINVAHLCKMGNIFPYLYPSVYAVQYVHLFFTFTGLYVICADRSLEERQLVQLGTS